MWVFYTLLKLLEEILDLMTTLTPMKQMLQLIPLEQMLTLLKQMRTLLEQMLTPLEQMLILVEELQEQKMQQLIQRLGRRMVGTRNAPQLGSCFEPHFQPHPRLLHLPHHHPPPHLPRDDHATERDRLRDTAAQA